MADLLSPSQHPECTTIFTRGQTLGLFIAAEVGLASVIAVVFLFGKIARNILCDLRQVRAKNWRFFKSPLDIYMISLLLSDLLQALGAVLDIKWVAQGSARSNNLVKQEFPWQHWKAIAVHTFFIIFFRRGARAMLLATTIVCVIWLYIIIFVVASLASQGDDFYTPTPYWCWVGDHFPKERIAGEYFWLWFSAVVSLGLYVPLFFCLRGNITVDANGWRMRFRRRPHATTKNVRNEDMPPGDVSQMTQNPAREALIMLLYPASYIALVAPLSIGRWIDFEFKAHHHKDIPPAVTFTIISIFRLSGLVNVILLIWTRPGLLHLSDVPRAPSFSDSEEFPADNSDPMRLHMTMSLPTPPPPITAVSHA